MELSSKSIWYSGTFETWNCLMGWDLLDRLLWWTVSYCLRMEHDPRARKTYATRRYTSWRQMRGWCCGTLRHSMCSKTRKMSQPSSFRSDSNYRPCLPCGLHHNWQSKSLIFYRPHPNTCPPQQPQPLLSVRVRKKTSLQNHEAKNRFPWKNSCYNQGEAGRSGVPNSSSNHVTGNIGFC
jgi:hypothetical protein